MTTNNDHKHNFSRILGEMCLLSSEKTITYFIYHAYVFCLFKLTIAVCTEYVHIYILHSNILLQLFCFLATNIQNIH